jgi:hypothetical protein
MFPTLRELVAELHQPPKGSAVRVKVSHHGSRQSLVGSGSKKLLASINNQPMKEIKRSIHNKLQCVRQGNNNEEKWTSISQDISQRVKCLTWEVG